MKKQSNLKSIGLMTTIIIIVGILPKLMAQNVGISSSGGAPDASAGLDVSFTDKGFLMPRMTTAQRDGISSPAVGLQIYNTDDACFQVYINSKWQNSFCDLECSTAPAVPGAITGATSPCQNATGVVYSIDQVAGATSYAWSVPSGATIVIGQGTTSIVVDYGTTDGNVSVASGNSCGISAYKTVAITLQSTPAQPSVITGTTPVCQGDNAVAYSVTNVAGVTYGWTYSGTGFTCATNCTTNSITANYSGSATSGTLTVTPSNACGAGTVRTLAITVNSIPATPTATAATNINSTDFDANWNAVAGATGYFLDVATDAGFTTFVTGYNNKSLGAVVTDKVSGLTCNTSYFYRVRATNSCGTTANSNVINPTSGTCFITATGGTITTDGNFKVHTFNSSGTFEVTSGTGSVEYLVIAGGGGGGSGPATRGAGGGGAGGYRTATGYAVSVNSYTVTVGAGGAVNAPGGNSVFATITSTGGGQGAMQNGSNIGSGGSGGGGGNWSAGGTGIAGQGFAGGTSSGSVDGAGGGGGGAGAPGGTPSGSNGGNGGAGLTSSITGTAVTRAGGGAGGEYVGASGTGGAGGGGKDSTPGVANTGSGGGGASRGGSTGSAGGSGVVIIRYQFQ